jgi:hypothetical protein
VVMNWLSFRIFDGWGLLSPAMEQLKDSKLCSTSATECGTGEIASVYRVHVRSVGESCELIDASAANLGPVGLGVLFAHPKSTLARPTAWAKEAWGVGDCRLDIRNTGGAW